MQSIEPAIYTVSQYHDLINNLLAEQVGEVLIEGEISDLRFSKNTWVTFDLKDNEAIINCFGHISKASVGIEAGMKVKVLGKSRIYPKYGKYSFSILAIEPVGEGSIRRAYQLLLQKLEIEGLFSQEHKSPTPRFPEKIGLITSGDGAALGDVRKILTQRWGGFSLYLLPVAVQGIESVPQVISALSYFNSHLPVDVIILTRGGGSLEDLQAFNDERVARSIFASRIPIIAAIGHERDVTIAELVADVRAATPSNAAQLCVPDRKEITLELNHQYQKLSQILEDRIFDYQMAIKDAIAALKLPILNAKNHFANLGKILESLNPTNVLARGYSMTIDQEGKLVKNAQKIKIGQTIITHLNEGKLNSEVVNVQS